MSEERRQNSFSDFFSSPNLDNGRAEHVKHAKNKMGENVVSSQLLNDNPKLLRRALC